MRRFDFIIQSNNPPKSSNLWIKDNTLYYFNNGKWVALGSDNTEDIEALETIIREVIYNDSAAIDSLKEVEDFLKDVDNGETLIGIIKDLKQEIDSKIDNIDLSQYATKESVDTIGEAKGFKGLEIVYKEESVALEFNVPSLAHFDKNNTQSYSIKPVNNETAGIVTPSQWNSKANVDDLPNIEGKEVDDDILADKINSIIPCNDTVLIASTSKYYRFDEEVNTLDIKLPLINDITKPQSLIVYFRTGENPAITISSEDKEISYFSQYNIEQYTTYELNIMFNGLKWIVGYGIIN